MTCFPWDRPCGGGGMDGRPGFGVPCHMLFFHKIGLQVEREEERAVLRAAALACGLEPVELVPEHAADDDGDDIDTVETWHRSEASLPFVITDRQVTKRGEDARATPAG